MSHTTSELIPVGNHGGGSDVIANVVFVHGLGGTTAPLGSTTRKTKLRSGLNGSTKT